MNLAWVYAAYVAIEFSCYFVLLQLKLRIPTLLRPLIHVRRCHIIEVIMCFKNVAKHGGCPSECDQIRENVGLLRY